MDMIRKSLLAAFIFVLFSHQITSQQYPTCTVPQSSVIDQILNRLLLVEEEMLLFQRFNQTVTEKLTMLEGQVEKLNDDLLRRIEENLQTMQQVVTLQTRLDSFIANQTREKERENLLNDPSWFNTPGGYQYRVTLTKQNWEMSFAACRDLGGVLAVDGIQNNDLRRSIALSLGLDNTWIGLSDRDNEGEWIWNDGTPATTSNTDWFPREPSNSGGNQNCGEIWGRNYNYRLNDDHCTKAQQALCERNINTD